MKAFPIFQHDKQEKLFQPYPLQRVDNMSSNGSNCPTDMESDDSMSSTSSTGSNGSSTSSNVSFGKVHVREYRRVLGHPTVPFGLTIGWEYSQKEPIPIKRERSIENHPMTDQPQKKKMRFNSFNLFGFFKRTTSNATDHETSANQQETGAAQKSSRVNTANRLEILKNFGYSRKELFTSERERVEYIHQQRQLQQQQQHQQSIQLTRSHESKAVFHPGVGPRRKQDKSMRFAQRKSSQPPKFFF